MIIEIIAASIVLILAFIFIINDQIQTMKRKMEIQYRLIQSLIVDIDELKKTDDQETDWAAELSARVAASQPHDTD